jgi:hypothetical protein
MGIGSALLDLSFVDTFDPALALDSIFSEQDGNSALRRQAGFARRLPFCRSSILHFASHAKAQSRQERVRSLHLCVKH